MNHNVDCTNNDIMNISELQKMQDAFSSENQVDLLCFDARRQMLTKPSVCRLNDELLQALISMRRFTVLLDNIGEESIEDVCYDEFRVSESDERIKVAALATRLEEKVILNWVIIGYSNVSTNEFWNLIDKLGGSAVELLRSTADYGKETTEEAGPDSQAIDTAGASSEKTIRSLEAMTSILRMIDANETIEFVMKKWLGIVSEYLEVDTAQVCRLSEGGASMDVLAEWTAPGQTSYFNITKDTPALPQLNTDTPVILSSDLPYEELANIHKVGLSAVMIFPLLRKDGGSGSLSVSFNHRGKEHIWTGEEVGFAADASRVLISIIIGRINKNSVASSFQALEEMLNNIGAAVFVVNRMTDLTIFCNRLCLEMFGKPEEIAKLRTYLSDSIIDNPEKGYHEIFYPETERWYDLNYKQLKWVDGSDVVLFSLYDITDRKSYQRKIEQQAFTDFLTGLYNRMCCERDLARMIDEAKRNDTHGALVYLDLDDFKHINDGLGHQYGDVLLKSISGALKSIRGIETSCYRMGGDEFVILIPPSSFPQLEVILKDIKGVFSRPWYLKDTDYYCTSSIGVVTFPELGDSVADLIRKADIAMYEAKKSGKNRLARYSEGQDSASGRRLDMERNMRDAENSNYMEFEVYYQPIIDVEDGEPFCAGAEALVRWNSIRLGFVSPGDFIPLAEYLGLINPIGNHVLLEACRTCKSWHDNGHPEMKINVNLSVVQLLQSDIVEIIEETLKLTALNPEKLCLEVTESLAINDMPRMLAILTKIKSLGVTIALDDFGTGYSSLNHIREIPFDIIKVDQSFVRDLADDAYSQSFVKMVAELADTLGVKICVEGIETAEQNSVLTDMKIKYIQGYYYDRPMPKTSFEAKYVNN